MICWKCWWPLSSTYSWDKECKDLMFQVSINPYGMLLTHKNYLMTDVMLMHFRQDKKLKFRFMIIVTCSLLASCLAYNSILKMETQCSYKTMVDFYQTTRRYNRGNLTPHINSSSNSMTANHNYDCDCFLHRCNCWNFTLYVADQLKLL